MSGKTAVAKLMKLMRTPVGKPGRAKSKNDAMSRAKPTISCQFGAVIEPLVSMSKMMSSGRVHVATGRSRRAARRWVSRSELDGTSSSLGCPRERATHAAASRKRHLCNGGGAMAAVKEFFCQLALKPGSTALGH